MSKLKTKTIKDLIPIFGRKIEQENVETVNARDVHEFLEVKTFFKDWIQRYIKRYDFIGFGPKKPTGFSRWMNRMPFSLTSCK